MRQSLRFAIASRLRWLAECPALAPSQAADRLAAFKDDLRMAADIVEEHDDGPRPDNLDPRDDLLRIIRREFFGRMKSASAVADKIIAADREYGRAGWLRRGSSGSNPELPGSLQFFLWELRTDFGEAAIPEKERLRRIIG